MGKVIRLRYSGFGGAGSYSADVRNTTKGIEISNVSKKYQTPYGVLVDMLSRFHFPHQTQATSDTEKGRKNLEKLIDKELIELEQKIEKYKLARQMCKRKHVFFKED